ncbi:MAG: hypothetical protein AB7D57_00725 [Desulfovibrionaceae bacterium]
MSGAVSGLFGGGPKMPSGPTAAELAAQRAADEAERKRKDEAQKTQSRENAARTRGALRRAGVASTVATGSSGLGTSATTAAAGLKNKLGQ